MAGAKIEPPVLLRFEIFPLNELARSGMRRFPVRGPSFSRSASSSCCRAERTSSVGRVNDPPTSGIASICRQRTVLDRLTLAVCDEDVIFLPTIGIGGCDVSVNCAPLLDRTTLRKQFYSSLHFIMQHLNLLFTLYNFTINLCMQFFLIFSIHAKGVASQRRRGEASQTHLP